MNSELFNLFVPFNQRSNLLNSELLMCRKIGRNRNVRKRVIMTEFGRIVLNLIFYFGSKIKIKVVAKSRWMFHCKS